MVITLDEILGDTAEYVAWQLEEGETTAEVSRAILDELAVPSTQPASGPAPETIEESMAKQKSVTQEKPQAKTATTQSGAAVKSPATSAPQSATIAAGDARHASLANLAKVVSGCTLCPLHEGRKQAVPGQGNPNPEILFVGEAPGADEDEQGLAFVGRAGKLLTKMIEAMGFTRDDVFIANVNKCRPPSNRKPSRQEMDACLPYLRQQVAILKPKVIVALGATAVEGLVPESATEKISHLRGKWLTFEGIPLMPTYHPAYLLRSPTMKKPAWEDLQEVLRHLGRPIPKRVSAS